MSIAAIDERSVAQLTAGQVVTGLDSAVKELVENALDAGATAVDVTLANHGRDGLAVQDNGCGVAPEDFARLGQRHATSKLQHFADLGSVRTLGFRGEALASLCALAHVRVTTSTGGPGFAFDLPGGAPKPVAAPRGTLVAVDDLFWSLPVRRKDFERNAPREFTKVVALLQEIAVLNPVRLSLAHTVKNRTQRVLQSHGAGLLQRVACVYGAKRTRTLVEVDAQLSFGSLRGCISRLQAGTGDTAAVCQLVAVNGRPTRQPAIVKAIVEVYRQLSIAEQPFFVLDLRLDPDKYDVNVTPDKRMVLLHDEFSVVDEVRNAIAGLCDADSHVVPRAEPPQKRQKLFTEFVGSGALIQQAVSAREVPDSEDPGGVTPPASSPAPAPASPASPTSPEPVSAPEHFRAPPTSAYARGDNELAIASPIAREVATALPRSAHASRHTRSSLAAYSAAAPPVLPDADDSSEDALHGASEDASDDVPDAPEDTVISSVPRDVGNAGLAESECDCSGDEGAVVNRTAPRRLADASLASLPDADETFVGAEPDSPLLEQPSATLSEIETVAESGVIVKSELLDLFEPAESCTPPQSPRSPRRAQRTPSQSPTKPTAGREVVQEEQSRALSARLLKTVNTHVHLPVTEDDLMGSDSESENESTQKLNQLQQLAIDDDSIDEKLSLSIKKEDFASMEIVGQFNLGFILVVSRKNNHDDLFVIDQHASDEIYNFENLQKSTVMSRQPLVAPVRLELSAVEELTIQEHISVFTRNGFSISVDTNAPPGSQCSLVAVPYSKNTVFDEKDVYELLGKIREQPGNRDLRCSRLRAMFAMRACRSSIMIGTALDTATMERVVRHLGRLDKPWNCPHGRPTLRHITSLK